MDRCYIRGPRAHLAAWDAECTAAAEKLLFSPWIPGAAEQALRLLVTHAPKLAECGAGPGAFVLELGSDKGCVSAQKGAGSPVQGRPPRPLSVPGCGETRTCSGTERLGSLAGASVPLSGKMAVVWSHDPRLTARWAHQGSGL